MSVNPTRTSTKILAILIVGFVAISAMFIAIIANIGKDNSPLDKDYNNSICWDRVVNSSYWPNGCKGSKTAEICAEVLIYLTDEEKQEYQIWVNAGKPAIDGCK